MTNALNRERESLASHCSRANLKDFIHHIPNTSESSTYFCRVHPICSWLGIFIPQLNPRYYCPIEKENRSCNRSQ